MLTKKICTISLPLILENKWNNFLWSPMNKKTCYSHNYDKHGKNNNVTLHSSYSYKLVFFLREWLHTDDFPAQKRCQCSILYGLSYWKKNQLKFIRIGLIFWIKYSENGKPQWKLQVNKNRQMQYQMYRDVIQEGRPTFGMFDKMKLILENKVCKCVNYKIRNEWAEQKLSLKSPLSKQQ